MYFCEIVCNNHTQRDVNLRLYFLCYFDVEEIMLNIFIGVGFYKNYARESCFNLCLVIM